MKMGNLKEKSLQGLQMDIIKLNKLNDFEVWSRELL